MLISLQIENFALIDQLNLEFQSGLNVLTGETGAGKSIILDAIDAVLGGKVTSRAVRTGADRALIEATFSADDGLQQWLSEQQIDPLDDQSLVCVREVTAGGRVGSRSRVNGVVVNQQQMKGLRDRLVEITAQGQTVQLGQPSLQREWLDSFGGSPLLHKREEVANAYSLYQQAASALERRRQMEAQRLQQLDVFEYQARELAAAKLEDPNELEQLEQERQRLSHTVELKEQSYQVYQLLYQNESGGESCTDQLGQAESILTDMVRFDSELQPLLDLVTEALASIQEAGREINVYGDNLEADPERLQEVQQRIGQLKQICKKYGPTLADAIAHAQSLQSSLETLNGSSHSIEELEQQAEARKRELDTLCSELTTLRKAAARQLESRLVEELKPLAMEKVQFQVEITPVSPTASGADRTVFLFSPNPGEPLQPLNEIASGGEMSRFLLALKACFSQIDPIGTMVFDEIDVGVSGRVAQAIADKLVQLGQRHQVLCVTHQPLVAAMATSHFRVDKQVVDQPVDLGAKNGRKKSKPTTDENGDAPLEEVRTVVRVNSLDEDQRRHELAQLMGGNEEAITFANSLREQAQSRKEAEPVTKTAETNGKSATSRRSKVSRK
jgi:DNA repair protein RecN (Recombination protein N)